MPTMELSRGVRTSSAFLAIAWGGLAAGVLDISSAFVLYALKGRGPDVVLHGIASGLLGRKAFAGGVRTALLGLACHFVIAFGAAATYYVVSRWWRLLVTRPVLCGLLYGIPVYVVTNFMVVPLSKIGRVIPNPPAAALLAMLILMFLVGLPIALATRRYSA